MEKSKERRERALSVTYGFCAAAPEYNWFVDDVLSDEEAGKATIRDWIDKTLTFEERSELIELLRVVPEVRECYLWRLREEKNALTNSYSYFS